MKPIKKKIRNHNQTKPPTKLANFSMGLHVINL